MIKEAVCVAMVAASVDGAQAAPCPTVRPSDAVRDWDRSLTSQAAFSDVSDPDSDADSESDLAKGSKEQVHLQLLQHYCGDAVSEFSPPAGVRSAAHVFFGVSGQRTKLRLSLRLQSLLPSRIP